MRYIIGVIHLAKKPITFKKAEWEIKNKRHSVVNDWLLNSGYFNIQPSDMIKFRHDIITLILNLKKTHNYKVQTEDEEDNEEDNDSTEMEMW